MGYTLMRAICVPQSQEAEDETDEVFEGQRAVSIHDALLKNGGSRTVFVPPGRAQRDDRPNHAYRRANSPEGMRA